MYRYSDYHCTECGNIEEIMHLKKEVPEEVPCPECDSTMLRKFPAPLVMRASFADGQERGERWTMAKQAAKLEQQASYSRKNGNLSDYKEMKQEANKLNKRSLNKRDKTDK